MSADGNFPPRDDADPASRTMSAPDEETDAGDGLTRPSGSISRSLVRAARRPPGVETVAVGHIIERLGERSFGWLLAFFSIITFLPLPPGASLITGIPLLLITAQLALGFPYVRLPKFITRRRLKIDKFRRAVVRARAVTRQIEKVIKPRTPWIFAARNERPLGVALFCIAFALFLPVPFTGWFPAVSILIVGLGFIERDGLAVLTGLGLGAASVALTVTLLAVLGAGANFIW
ncbi:exopolysaccharide biosynthesis protein [Tranquillimonas alkanivorans]|uniref:Uncharacterized conserved protein n=1 Tax=Tranquillimonas alkanivorans TaxID=441119 RepID=A0A1I5N2N6_9RHOB|nr:exopolysaccharide biosynthesis protein [Tranquillimonas alkanivorans]SFP16088.1 Uncharacterized conserved protein [Tranquillimonas alkanivorans]